MPGIFTFGIPNHFNFTFRAGLKPDNTNSGASSQAKSLVLSPLRGMGNTDSCGILTRLPLEIRIMVYTNVLRSERNIRQAHDFLGRHPPIMAADARHLEAIDSALLRTCRTIYREAIRVLYATNRFRFRSPSEIHQFAHVGMETTPFGSYCTAREPSSAVSNAPCGRLTMVRFLTLRISSGSIGDDRNKIWSSWCDFFYPPKGQDQSVGFPALERLALDFTDWGLNAGNASKLRVKPFLKRLRPTGGLRHLTIIGVEHEQNIRDFKHGFVRQGGTFRTASSSDKTVSNFTVTHDDLPMVSMYVQAVVEMDRALRAILDSEEGTRD